MTKVITVTQQMIDDYGKINGDKDIIHYDHDYALKRGFRGTLAHGLMVQGYANDEAVKTYGEDWFYRGHIEVKFTGPTCPGDELTVDVPGDGSLSVDGPEGKVIVGTATLRVAE